MKAPISRRLLSRRELRFVGGGVAGVVGLGLLLGGLWLSPWSPSHMDRANRLAAQGDLVGAVDTWLAVADAAASQDAERDARWQAAWLASVDTAHPQRSVEMLRDYATRYPADPQSAVAFERLATLYSLYLRDPIRAAEAWEAAAGRAPAAPQAGKWLLEAGLAYADAGLHERAVVALEASALHVPTATSAHLALGRLQLSDDAASAYDHYTTALGLAPGDNDASLARLGVATALESLDRVDQALAELETADREDVALNRRRARLEKRDRR